DDVYEVSIETGGHVSTKKYIELAEELGHIHFCVDYKLPASGMHDKMNPHAFEDLRECDSVKYVVGTQDDFDVAMNHLHKARANGAKWLALFSPCWEASFTLRDLAEALIDVHNYLHPVTYSLQIHKVVWEPTTRKV